MAQQQRASGVANNLQTETPASDEAPSKGSGHKTMDDNAPQQGSQSQRNPPTGHAASGGAMLKTEQPLTADALAVRDEEVRAMRSKGTKAAVGGGEGKKRVDPKPNVNIRERHFIGQPRKNNF
eukprot:CAMPEP_0177772262 /NCGR_PEP_ID=MMETSP0491_2-20121128/12119_1 /TAXON_ID=63592 /ORGANISM="Tetraselmis chuii, Strain PLY429" /LENGTH=122 /DNA_ID=CAMNT_0019290041 /DNA_START=259 /DNA_END=627 /DNA_ORIENTATION=+